ncbi:MAG: anti-sigma factor [Xanthobacteraceae bacterium]|nr:MAG: anti-sigma factor [Xanthobacteraceae bacterium]
MIEPGTSVTEDELHAYADGELPDDRRAAVEAWLAARPEEARRVASWRAIADAIQDRYGKVADEPVPGRLALDRLAAPSRRRIAYAVAAVLAAFVIGGTIGWFAHGITGGSSLARNFTADALDAHRLYVVEVRHPVEVEAAERAHLVQWLSKRLGYAVHAPQLEAAGLKFVGGRLLPGPGAPAAFLMYEAASGERYTLYCARAATNEAGMRFTARDHDNALFWADNGIGYVLAGPGGRDRLQQVAGLVYDQIEDGGHAVRR